MTSFIIGSQGQKALPVGFIQNTVWKQAIHPKKFPAIKLLCYSWPRSGSLTLESLGTSFDCYVLGACGSNTGLARMVQEKIHCSCIGAIITSSKTETGLRVFGSCFHCKKCDRHSGQHLTPLLFSDNLNFVHGFHGFQREFLSNITRTKPMRHGCNYNCNYSPQQSEKICRLNLFYK